MANYKANSTNSLNFNLTSDNKKIGELVYEKWYASKADLQISDGNKYQLEPKGFWDSKIELKDKEKTLLEFKLGWNGIIIKTFFNDIEENYMLELKGFSTSKFILTDSKKSELLVADLGSKLNNLNYDFNIETNPEFDNFPNKDVLILAILHCINYYIYITTIVSAG